jgi:MoxR-like ATPase
MFNNKKKRTMNFKEAKDLCMLVLNTDNLNKDGLNLTPMLWGGAGIGKTSLVKEVAEELGYELRVISLNTLSPLDVRGMPYIPADNPEAFRFIPADFVPTGKEEKPVLLFFDEINTAPPLSQVVAYQIALERNLGGHLLPVYTITLMIEGQIHEIKTTRKTAVILAGNRSEDKGATFEMPYPLANRLIHFDVQPDADAFAAFAFKNNINTGIVAFIKSNNDYLHKMSSKEYAFATPRSWHMLSVGGC